MYDNSASPIGVSSVGAVVLIMEKLSLDKCYLNSPFIDFSLS